MAMSELSNEVAATISRTANTLTVAYETMYGLLNSLRRNEGEELDDFNKRGNLLNGCIVIVKDAADRLDAITD